MREDLGIWRWRVGNFAATESNPTTLVCKFATTPGKINVIVGDFPKAVGNVTLTIYRHRPTSILCCFPYFHYHRLSLPPIKGVDASIGSKDVIPWWKG
jgi:hypothetical protein